MDIKAIPNLGLDLDTVTFHAVSNGPNRKRLHLKITEEGHLIGTEKEPGSHIEPFLKVPRSEAISFMKGILGAAEEFGIKLPDSVTGTNEAERLKAEIEWLREEVKWLRAMADKTVKKL